MATTSVLAGYALVLAVATTAVWKYFSGPLRDLPLPPGPKGRPVIGNLLDMPSGWQWLTFDQWAKAYGDIVYVEVFGQRVVVLSSVEAVTELFERRSSTYSSRPRFVMIMELMGFEWLFSSMPYGERWRARRRAFHPHFHQGAIDKWEPVQLREARAFTRRVLAGNPQDLVQNIRHLFGASIMDIVYGITVAEKDDEYTAIAEPVVDYLSRASLPGAYVVDTLPILKYVPAWFPGASFQRKAAHCRQLIAQMINKPFGVVKEAMAHGETPDCIAAELIKKYPSDNDNLSRDVAAIAYTAGSDTTVSAVTSFFLAMATHPHVQKRAQAELDVVVGSDRLPDYSDRPHLPYVNALISEVLRWLPVTPLAVPHSTDVDDEYRGYFIPAGTFVIGNSWSILHDADEYPEPDVFMPERFLTTNADGTLAPNTAVRDPRTASFGFGRRICPGRHMAEQSIYAVVASVLSVYWIAPALDKAGAPVPLEVKMTPGLISHPAPFRCSITPRSTHAEELVRESGASPAS